MQHLKKSSVSNYFLGKVIGFIATLLSSSDPWHKSVTKIKRAFLTLQQNKTKHRYASTL